MHGGSGKAKSEISNNGIETEEKQRHDCAKKQIILEVSAIFICLCSDQNVKLRLAVDKGTFRS